MDVVVGIVQNGKHFAFLERIDGSWTFPSGKVEPDEALELAILREIEEETGLKAQIINLFGSRQIGDVTLHYFLARHIEGDLVLNEPDKFQSITWATAREIIMTAGDNLFPAVKNYFQSQFSQRLSLGLG